MPNAIDVQIVMQEIRERVRHAANSQQPKLGSSLPPSPPLPDIDALERAGESLSCRKTLVGRMPPEPPTFRGRIGAVLVAIVRRSLFWFTSQLQDFHTDVVEEFDLQVTALKSVTAVTGQNRKLVETLDGRLDGLSAEVKRVESILKIARDSLQQALEGEAGERGRLARGLAAETAARESTEQNLRAEIAERQELASRLVAESIVRESVQQTLAAEVATRKSAERTLRTEIAEEREQLARRLAAETGSVQKALAAEMAERERLARGLAAEVAARKGVEQTLRTEIAEEREQVARGLAAEVAARESAEQMLRGEMTEREQVARGLAAEVAARESTEQLLRGEMAEREQLARALAAEVAAREGAEQLLRGEMAEREQLARALAAEVAAREGAEQTLRGEMAEREQLAYGLAAEVAARESAEQTLRGEMAEREQLARGLAAEVAARESAEQMLRGEIAEREQLARGLAAEVAARESAEQLLRGEIAEREQVARGLAAEVAARESAEQTLRAETAAREALALSVAENLRGSQELDANYRHADMALHQLRAEVSSQGTRISILLEEVRKKVPNVSTETLLVKLVEEDHHALDGLYLALEDRFRGSREEIKERMRYYLPLLQNRKIGAKKMPIADLGCGRGEWLELLTEAGLEVYGVDTNRIFIAACKERGLRVFEEDVLQHLRALPDSSLGAVTGFHIIEHLPLDILVRLIDETVRVLKPSGLAIFETPNPQNLLVGCHNFYIDPTHRNPIPSLTAQFLLEARGLCDVQIVNMHPYSESYRIPNGGAELAQRFNEYFYGPQDYAVIGRRV